MKKLNLKTFSLTVLLCSAFVVIPPYQVQSKPPVVRQPPVRQLKPTVIDYVKNYFTQNNINYNNININEFCSEPNALNGVMVAQHIIKEFTDNMYLYYDLSDPLNSIEITTNAPTGFRLNTPQYQAVIVTAYADGGTITPHIAILLACIEVAVVVIICGIAYYIVIKICKWVKTVISNNEYQQTNIINITSLSLKNAPPVSHFKRVLEN